jgi:hypothetical protein
MVRAVIATAVTRGIEHQVENGGCDEELETEPRVVGYLSGDAVPAARASDLPGGAQDADKNHQAARQERGHPRGVYHCVVGNLSRVAP